MAGSWNYMICKFPSNPNHFGIMGLFSFLSWDLLQMENNPRRVIMESELEEAFTISVSPLQRLLTTVVGRVLEHLKAAGTEGNVSVEQQPPHLDLYNC